MVKKRYTAEEINTLIERFETQKLPKSEWTHEAHLVVAIWYLLRYDYNQALDLVREYITMHNESVGTPNSDSDGYHETITRFWMWNAQRFLSLTKYKSVAAACNAFIHSEFGQSDYPLTYYSQELLFSLKARKEWVQPDRNNLEKVMNTLIKK